MKFLIRFILYFIISIFLLIIFSPKKELFYFAENFLVDKKVIVNNEKFSDFGLGFSIKDGDIYYDGLLAGKLENITVVTSLFYNSLSTSEFIVSKELSDFMPAKINFVEVKHIFWKPNVVSINSEGEFGKVYGQADLITRKIKLTLEPASIMNRKYQQILRMFKKTKDGYIYEYSF